MATVPIPLVTFPVGTRVFGPVSIPSAIAQATITLNRSSGAHPLDGAPSDTTVQIDVQISFDGGASWRLLASTQDYGAPRLFKDGTAVTTLSIGASLPPQQAVARQVQAAVTVTGKTQVSVDGTLVTG